MKNTQAIDQAELARLLREEGWDKALPEVLPKPLKMWQQAVFWGLRVYIIIMLLVVMWAFSHGVHT
ncbi:MAG: hypothetical protein ACYDEV_00850 [Acidiferrobacter sp.]